jgi:hypothetical protein
MRTILLAAAFLAAFAAPALAGAEDDALIALERQRSAAIAVHDMAFLSRLYDDDFRGITAAGFQVDKPTLMEVFKRDDPNTRFTLDQLETRIVGDTALLWGRLTGRDAKGTILSQSRYNPRLRATRWTMGSDRRTGNAHPARTARVRFSSAAPGATTSGRELCTTGHARCGEGSLFPASCGRRACLRIPR